MKISKRVLCLCLALILPAPTFAFDATQAQRLGRRFDGGAVMGVTPASAGFLIPVLLGGCPPKDSPASSEPDVVSATTTAQIAQMMREILQNHPGDWTEQQLRDAAMDGMLHSLDTHSELYRPQALTQMQAEDDGRAGFAGVGIQFSKRNENEYPAVYVTVPDSPSFRSGIRAGDIVVSVDGDDARSIDQEDLISRIRGEPGTTVKLGIVTPGQEPRIVILTREDIALAPIIYSEMVIPGTGYIDFSAFDKGSAQKFYDTVTTLKGQGMNRLIIDLRGNPGGYLDEAAVMTGLFLPHDSLILSVRKKDGTSQRYATDDANGLLVGLPLIILVNHGSASASEVFSGSLQDHQRAVLIGSRTWGKGTVQQIFSDVPERGYGYKMTTAKYYLPSGRTIDGEDQPSGGIAPNVEVRVEEETQAQVDQDRSLRRMLQPPSAPTRDEVLITAIRYFASQNSN